MKGLLKRTSSLSSKSGPRVKSGLSNKGCGLKSRQGLKAKTALKSATPLRAKRNTAKVSPGAYFSIFGSMDICAITGEKNANLAKGKRTVVPHHIFGGPYKEKSERYGFILPLRRDWHTGMPYSIHQDDHLDKKCKRICQRYFVDVLGHSEEEFVEAFGKNYEVG